MRSFNPGKVPKNNPKKGGIQKIKKVCQISQQKLKKTKITNEDYKESFKKHDSKDTFTYMDPPYVKSYNPGTWPKEKVHPEDVCKLAKEAKGKVMISYDNHPRVRKACKGLKIKKVQNDMAMRNPRDKNPKKVKELIITNY